MAVGEWDERQLCPDGGCTGLIGADGHCKVCNRVATNWGNERDRGLHAKSTTDAPVADDELGEDEEWDDEEDANDAVPNEEAEKLAELDPSTPSLIGAPAEWSKRTLCSDGACIGVIGTDGRCKTCGKPAKGTTEPLASAIRVPVAPDDDAGDDDDSDEDEDEDDEDGDDEDDDDDEDSDEAAPSAADAELLAAATDMAAGLPTEEDFNRKLCPDGACVGVIGADGRCKVCGKEPA